MVGVVHAIRQNRTTFERLNDFTEGDFLRCFSQGMAPFGTASACDQTRLFEGSDNLLQEFDRYVLSFGDVLDSHRGLSMVPGEIKEQSGSVSRLGRELHPFLSRKRE
jgi:hypothetical protein